MIVMPPRITARQSAPPPRLDYRFVYPDVFHEAKVRIVVYQFDIYKAHNYLRHLESPDLFKFKTDYAKAGLGGAKQPLLDNVTADPSHGTQLDPKLANESGVLLKLDGTLLRSNKVPSPGGWWFGKTAQPVENSDAPSSVVHLHMPTTEEDAIAGRVNPNAVARIIVRADGFQNAYKKPSLTPHRLVFRVALVLGHAGLPAGTVIASSLCPEHNPACSPEPPGNPYNTGVIIFEDAVVKVGKPPEIGGSPGGVAPLPPTPNPRHMPFDLTGWFEHDNGSNDAQLLVQINQIGYCIVGWFSPPPTNMPGLVTGKAIAGLPALPGCFWLGSMAAPLSKNGYQILWRSQSSPGINTSDPDTMNFPEEGQIGWLKPIPGRSDYDLEDRAELTFEHSDGSSPTTIQLKKVRNGARWPWQLINNNAYLTDDERKAVIADQVQPVPKTVWERIRAQLDPNVEVVKSPKRTLKDLISDWFHASDGSARDKPRADIGNHLYNIMSPFTLGYSADYRRDAGVRIRAYASQFKVKVGSQEKTVLEWMKSMVGTYMTDLLLKEENKKYTVEQLYERVEQGFKICGIRPDGKYVYTLKFNQKGKDVLVFKVYGFQVTISKQVRQDDGTLLPDKEWSDKSYDKKKLNGFFIAGGIGFGFGPKGKGKATRGGAFPGEAVFQSFSNLQLADFNGAWFSIVALALATFDVGIIKGGVIPSSSMFQLELKNGVCLTAIVVEDADANFALGKPSGGKLIDISAGFGKITTDDIPKSTLPPKDDSGSIMKPSTRDIYTTVPVLFDKDSATVIERNLFERALAVNRGLYELEEPYSRIIGYASPEGTSEHNLDLSWRRAVAVQTAFLDAIPPDLELQRLEVDGLGEEPSIETGGLLDPPGKSDAERKRVHEEEAEYPRWRSVSFYVGGVMLVRATSKDEKKGRGK